MLVVDRELQSASTSSGLQGRHQYLPAPAPIAVPVQQVSQQPQLDLALEGRSIPLQQRTVHPINTLPAHPRDPASRDPVSSTFSPSCLQLRIDLLSEQGVEEDEERPVSPQKGGPLSRRQRAQLKRRQEQQKPAEEVVYQRRSRPKTPACPRLPLTMSTMSMPAAGQKFVTDDASFGSAEEASAAVKRLLAKNEHHVTSHVTSHVKSATFISDGYLQDSFDFLHQRHMKNLTDVISRHRQQQPQQPQQPQQEEEEHASQLASKFKKQVHIHQSSFYDANNENISGDPQTFKSTKSINLTNSNNNSSSDMEDKRRYVREDSASSLRSGSSDNCNNNYCDTINKSNSKVSSKSSTSSTTSSTSSSTTRVQQSFTTKKQVIKQSFSSSSQDFDDRIGIDVMLTPSQGAMVLAPAEVGSMASVGTKKVKETSKVTSSVYSSSSDRPDECKQSVKSTKSKTVKKMVSDGKQVHTDVDKFSETAVEEAEGAGDKPVITFSHVSSEGSHQAFTDNIVRFDSSTLSSPSRSRSPSPLLEMPAPYSDLSREIKRPPIQKA